MAREIPLNHGYAAIVDDLDFEWLSPFTWRVHHSRGQWHCAVTTAMSGKGITRTNHFLTMHRVIMRAQPGEQIDHINGNTLDNRRDNLRIVNNTQNHQNQHRVYGRSRFKGVGWHGQLGKWQALIKVNGKSKYLGVYATEEEAARAYDRAAREHFGEYARPNFSEATA